MTIEVNLIEDNDFMQTDVSLLLKDEYYLFHVDEKDSMYFYHNDVVFIGSFVDGGVKDFVSTQEYTKGTLEDFVNKLGESLNV